MKYIVEDKTNDSRKEVSREEAIELLKSSYRNPEYTLDNYDSLFNNLINLQWCRIRVVENCCIENCKGEYGGWIDCSWHRKGEFQSGRLPFCKEHFKKVHKGIKEYEKKHCKDGSFLAFAPLDEITKILKK